MRLNHQVMPSQQGFTLIELIVALAIGLIVSAAALQLFTGSLITTRMQDASAELQDSGIFGLEYMAKDIRLANYNNVDNPVLNDQTAYGGIVLTSGLVNANLPLASVSGGLLSGTGVGAARAGGASDQLTIQYRAPNDMTNCEGELVSEGQHVIQRYFLRRDATGGANDLALACDANDPTPFPATSVAGMATTNQGEVIMPRVDALRFYLGARQGVNLRYYTIAQYQAAANAARVAASEPPRIVSVKIDVLVRSRDNTTSEQIDLGQSFPFLSGAITPTDQETRFMRRMYTTTVSIRNGFGDSP